MSDQTVYAVGYWGGLTIAYFALGVLVLMALGVVR